MAYYAFTNSILPGKVQEWKNLIGEMNGHRSTERNESRKRAALSVERVWLQHSPVGDFAVVYWEADDISKVFETFMTSEEAFNQWFREKILVGIHGMDISKPPPMNDLLLDYNS
jgi:hypothetical protein